MEEQRVSDERLAELIADCKSSRAFRQLIPDYVLAMATELLTSRAALSEAEGLVREMAAEIFAAGYQSNPAAYINSNSKLIDILARPSVAAILARGEK